MLLKIKTDVSFIAPYEIQVLKFYNSMAKLFFFSLLMSFKKLKTEFEQKYILNNIIMQNLQILIHFTFKMSTKNLNLNV